MSRGFEQDIYLRLVRHIEDSLQSYPVDGTRDEKWEFYSALDESYRQEWIRDALLDWLWHPNLVLSGGFGGYLAEKIKSDNLPFDYLLFNGQLREGRKPELWDSHSYTRNFYEEGYTPTWWFIDDSYYSGRTKLVLSKELKEYSEYKLTNTVVIYNGCPRWSPDVNAVYSWYMMHGLD